MDLLNQPILFYLISGAFTTSALFFIFKFFGVIISEQDSMRYFNKGKDVYTGFLFFVFYILFYLALSFLLLNFLNINIRQPLVFICLIVIFFLLSGSVLVNFGKISVNFNKISEDKEIVEYLEKFFTWMSVLFKKIIKILFLLSLFNSLILILIIGDYNNNYFFISLLLIVLNYILICVLSAFKKKRKLTIAIVLKKDKKIENVELIFMDNNFIMFKDGDEESILKMNYVQEIKIIKNN